MKCLLSHAILTLLCLLPALGFSVIIDDCTKPPDYPFNNLGYKRGIDGGGKEPDAPTKGIFLMDENDVWVETLAETGKVLDLTSQAIIIRYTSEWHSVLTIQLRQKDMSREGNVLQLTTSTLVEISPTDNIASIPMHLFPGASLAHVHELTIQSFNPLIVESIELVYHPYIKLNFFTNLDHFKKLVPVDDAIFTHIINVPRNTNFMHEVRYRIMNKDPVHLFEPWNYHMTDEVKQVGYRDFFTVASREIFVPSPTNYYFEYTKTGSKNIQMIPHSPSLVGVTDHYRFIGRFIGMAIYFEQPLDISLSIVIYKIILQKPITLADVYSIDPSMYKYLQFILDHDVDTLRLTMSSAIMYKDNQRVHIQDFVIPDGRHVFVTNENKHKYVKHLIDWRYMTSINKKHTKMFRDGILEIIPNSVLKIFDEHELKLILEGQTDLDVDDWRKHTKYNSGYNSQDLIIQWFWEYVELLKGAHRSKLLEFVTGSPRLPITGFKGLMGHNFAIHRYHVLIKDNVDDQVPLGLKNMNILILPCYSTFEIMTKQLNQAIGI